MSTPADVCLKRVLLEYVVIVRKGIILAGGTGSRLFPVTLASSKQLLPVYDKPMIYYPLSTLMLAGVREVLIITTPRDAGAFRSLLGDGARWGLDISYITQQKPEGLAQALILGKSFLNGAPSILILGDNIFYGHGLTDILRSVPCDAAGATIFGYRVSDPERFGVMEVDASGKVLSLEEKPSKPKSNFCVTGLYFYDTDACHFAEQLKPSARGELEITDLNKIYLEEGRLDARLLGRGYAWLDTGTHDSLLDASGFIASLQRRQGLQVACLEEIALEHGWISFNQVETNLKLIEKSSYGEYLKTLISAHRRV